MLSEAEIQEKLLSQEELKKCFKDLADLITHNGDIDALKQMIDDLELEDLAQPYTRLDDGLIELNYVDH